MGSDAVQDMLNATDIRRNLKAIYTEYAADATNQAAAIEARPTATKADSAVRAAALPTAAQVRRVRPMHRATGAATEDAEGARLTSRCRVSLLGCFFLFFDFSWCFLAYSSQVRRSPTML